MDSIAAHCEGCSLRHSKTSRTARSRTSGENFTDFFMAPSSQELEPPPNPGRFNTAKTDYFSEGPGVGLNWRLRFIKSTARCRASRSTISDSVMGYLLWVA